MGTLDTYCFTFLLIYYIGFIAAGRRSSVLLENCASCVVDALIYNNNIIIIK